MKPRTLLVLLALVVGLGAFVWFYEREQPGSEEREKLAKRVLGVKREDVVGLELHAGDRATELVRTHHAGETPKGAAKKDEQSSGPGDGGAAGDEAGGTGKSGDDQDRWRLRRPIDFPADYWQVDALVRSLAELDHVRTLDQYDAKEVGLDPPRGRVIVELADGKKKELRIGSEVPGSGNVIVAVEGEKGASVVAGSLWESVSKDAAEWRDKDLFAPEREDIVAMTLEHGPVAEAAGATTSAAAPEWSTVRLTKAGDDFELAAPVRDRADADAVNALVRELTGLHASQFLDSPPALASVGLDPPRARLTVELAEGEPFVLLWGARKEGAAESGSRASGSQESYAKVGDLVVTTAAALDEPLERAASAWRSKDWSAMPVFEVDQVTVSDAKGTLGVTRDEGSWKRGEDAIQYGPVSDFLYAIDDAKAERLAEPAEVEALGQPETTITFGAVDEAEKGKTPTVVAAKADGASVPSGSGVEPSRTERLELYAATPENLVPARTEGRDAVLLLRRETRDQILAKLQAVRDAKPATEEPMPTPQPDSSQE